MNYVTLIITLLSFNQLHQSSAYITIKTCNCSQPTTIGLVDLTTSKCDATEDGAIENMGTYEYELVSTTKPGNMWKGHACYTWTIQTKITGYWLGSYDTTTTRETRATSVEECKTMVERRECIQDNGDNYKMLREGSRYVFRQNPTGDHYYNQVTIYSMTNCVFEEIKIHRECEECLMFSTIGPIPGKPEDKFSIFDHTTVFWTADVTPGCQTVSLHSGKATFLRSAATQQVSVIDKEDQLKFIINTKTPYRRDARCTAPTRGYKITTDNDTYIIISEEAASFIKSGYKQTDDLILSPRTNPELFESRQKDAPSNPDVAFPEKPSDRQYGTLCSKSLAKQCFRESRNEMTFDSVDNMPPIRFAYTDMFQIKIIGTKRCLWVNDSANAVDTLCNSNQTWLVNPSTHQISIQGPSRYRGYCLHQHNMKVVMQPCFDTTAQQWMFTSQRSEHRHEQTVHAKDPEIKKEVQRYLRIEEEMLRRQDGELLLAINKLTENVKTAETELAKQNQYNATQLNGRSGATWLSMLHGNGTREKYNIPVTADITEQLNLLKEAKINEYNRTNMRKLAEEIARLHGDHDIDARDIVRNYKNGLTELQKNLTDDARKVISKVSACHPSIQQMIKDQEDGTMWVVPSELVAHRFYLENRALERENILAKEITDVVCQMHRMKRELIIALASSSGILAAKSAGILRPCARLQNNGENLILQQCQQTRADFSAIRTPCGYEPFYNNHSISTDGYSLVPFTECLWRNNIVNFNGQGYTFKDNDWHLVEFTTKPQAMKINTTTFKEEEDKEIRYVNNRHPIYEDLILDNDNLLNEIKGHATHQGHRSIKPLLLNNDFSHIFDGIAAWMNNVRNGIITTIVMIATIITIPALIKVIILSVRRCKKSKSPTTTTAERMTINNLELATRSGLPTISTRNPFVPPLDESYYVMGVGRRSANDTAPLPRLRNY